jgi:hypothetical protein
VRCGGRELLAAGDNDPVLGLFDDVQCDFLVLGDGALPKRVSPTQRPWRVPEALDIAAAGHRTERLARGTDRLG